MPAPSEGLYCPPTPAPHAFSAHGKTPSLGLSGSSWGLKQIQHCYINFKSDLEAIQLIVSPDLVPDNSIIAAHLRQTLSREWLDILKSCETNSGQQPLSTLDRSLGELASLKWSEHSYHSSSSLELKSSPPIDQSPSNPSLEEQRKTQTPTHSPESSMRTSPSPLSSSPLARYSTSHLLPAQSQEENNLSIEQRNFPSSTPPETTRSFVGIGSPPRLALSSKPGDLRIRSHSTSSAETDLDETASQAGNAQGHADWSPQPELPRHRPIVQQHEVKTSPLQPRLVPYSSSSPLVEHRSSPSAHSNASLASRHNLGLDPVPEEDRDERSVECVTRLFIGVIIDSIRAAASAPTRSNPKGWIIRDQVDVKTSDKFSIAGYTINANPDCTIFLRVEDAQQKIIRDVFLHFEVKRLIHGLSPYAILGQELSELLAEAMQMKDRLRKEIETIPVSTHKFETSDILTATADVS